MTSDRPYRKAMTPEKAIQTISESAGKQFSPELTQIFLQTVQKTE
jgi:HD-GYP domain-containing protein (c-di-GMP phosphodiesterase class II)